MEVPYRSALLYKIAHESAFSEQLGIKLLLVFVVGADACDECPRSHHVALDEVLLRSRASDNDIALRDSARKILDGRGWDAALRFERDCECRSSARILIVSADARGLTDPQQRSQLCACLTAAPADQHRLACFAGQILRS